MKRTALITGASSGLGLEFAREFARDGHNVVLSARRREEMETLADELRSAHGVQVWVKPADLSRMEEIDRLHAELKEENIAIDFLVNNAGFGDFALFHEARWEKLERMMDLNIKALTKLSYLFVKPMIERGFGKILQIASTASFQPGPTMAVYYASKAYVLSLGEAMSNELKGSGVHVTVLCPGATESGFQDAADLDNSRLVKGKKLPSAAEVAAFGYKKMKQNRMTVIHGMLNRIMAFSIRLTPRAWVLPVVRYMQNAV